MKVMLKCERVEVLPSGSFRCVFRHWHEPKGEIIIEAGDGMPPVPGEVYSVLLCGLWAKSDVKGPAVGDIDSLAVGGVTLAGITTQQEYELRTRRPGEKAG